MTNESIRLLRVVHNTVVDGPGVRTSLYAGGCDHRCSGCHNQESWRSDRGELYAIEELLGELRKNPYLNLTFTGGDPLLQVEPFTELARRVKEESSKTIWCYTGYRFEEVVASESLSKILPYLDVLVDGRFEESLKSPALPFRGSSNQRLIDVQSSLRTNRVVEFAYNPFPEF